MRLRFAVHTVAALMASAPALPAQEPAAGVPAPLCMTLELVARPDGADPARWGRVHHPPDTVLLDTARSLQRNGRSGFRLHPPIGSRDLSFSTLSPFWRFANDTLEMIWTNGLTGVHLRGRLDGRVYRGDAMLVTDVRTPDPLPHALVEGALTPCPVRFRR